MTAGSRKSLRYAGVVIIGLFAVLLVGKSAKESSLPTNSGDKRISSVNFPHALHVTEMGIECVDCHTSAMESTVSSDLLLPNHENCESCHSDKLEEDCAFCHINPDDIGPSVNPVRELIFAHQKHAGTAGISCVTCHGSILDQEETGEGGSEEEMEVEEGENEDRESEEEEAGEEQEPSAMTAGLWSTGEHLPGMALCVDCHSERGVSRNCETCHTNFVTLIPENHLVSGFYKEHRRPARAGEMYVSCQTCHQESFCQDCHTVDEVSGFGATGGLMAVPAARTAFRDRPEELRLQAAHDLNYRYTHGIDARSRIVDCASCHDRQTFCVECHQAGGNVLQGVIKPQSHFEAGFVMIGAGSGGGRHAEMGRRDIESCISCHDVEGADPTCILCHSGK